MIKDFTAITQSGREYRVTDGDLYMDGELWYKVYMLSSGKRIGATATLEQILTHFEVTDYPIVGEAMYFLSADRWRLSTEVIEIIS
jgi:hypothetical protein